MCIGELFDCLSVAVWSACMYIYAHLCSPVLRMENTVYLEVQGRAVRPSIVVASSHGQTKLDFGEVTIGRVDRCIPSGMYCIS